MPQTDKKQEIIASLQDTISTCNMMLQFVTNADADTIERLSIPRRPWPPPVGKPCEEINVRVGTSD